MVLVPEATLIKYRGSSLLGRTLAERYGVFDILGVGGFGTVYRAYDSRIDSDVAIKIILPEADIIGADSKARFRQEADLLAQLKSNRIVRVFDIGETDGLLYMVLQLVPGKPLKQLLKENGALGLERAVSITAQVLEGLSDAHAMGLIHRDLKPGNILVDQDREDDVKLIDFGIAKVMGAHQDEAPKTGTGLVLGTVRYMAPEQLREDGLASPQTDLYSVGILFFEMLTGRPPYNGSPAEIAAAQLYAAPPDIPEAFGIPELSDWFGRVMRKSPTERYVDALTMRADLVHAMPNETTIEKSSGDYLFIETNDFSGGWPTKSVGTLIDQDACADEELTKDDPSTTHSGIAEAYEANENDGDLRTAEHVSPILFEPNSSSGQNLDEQNHDRDGSAVDNEGLEETVLGMPAEVLAPSPSNVLLDKTLWDSDNQESKGTDEDAQSIGADPAHPVKLDESSGTPIEDEPGPTVEMQVSTIADLQGMLAAEKTPDSDEEEQGSAIKSIYDDAVHLPPTVRLKAASSERKRRAAKSISRLFESSALVGTNQLDAEPSALPDGNTPTDGGVIVPEGEAAGDPPSEEATVPKVTSAEPDFAKKAPPRRRPEPATTVRLPQTKGVTPFWWMLPSLAIATLVGLLIWVQPPPKKAVKTYEAVVAQINDAVKHCDCLTAKRHLDTVAAQLSAQQRIQLSNAVSTCKPAVNGQCSKIERKK